MSDYLPYNGYQWVKEQDLNHAYLDALTLPADSDHGYIFEVDAEIPDHLHDKFNDLPPMPLNREIDAEELSKSYQLPLAEELGIKLGSQKKLICDLLPKKSYVLHYRNLQAYMKLGVIITGVKSAIKFNQKPFLKMFIDKNSEMRANAISKLEKDFWKLMNNR